MRRATLLALLVACTGNSHHQHDTLVRVDAEAAGVNCSSGGVAIETGADTNDDGILENAEITATQYVCNGTAQLQCPAGGTSVTGPITITTTPDFLQLAGIECIDGDLLITNLTDSALQALPDLAVVTGSVVVAGNSQLTSLDGLSIQQVGSTFLVQANPDLVDVAALTSIVKSGPIQIVANDTLTDVAGLAPITRVDGLVIAANANLTSLHGLENLLKINPLTIRENPKLATLDALAQLREAGSLDISGNAILPAISLPALTKIDNGMAANSNPMVASIDLPVLTTTNGLDFENDGAMTSVTAPQLLITGGLMLQHDPFVATLSLPKLEFATNGTWLISVPKLQAPDLGSLSAVSTILYIDSTGFTDFTGLGALHYVSGDVRITNNADLSGFSGLAAMQEIDGNLLISGNPALSTSTAMTFANQLSVGGTVTIN